MKGQLWYKSHGDHQSRKLQDDVEVLTEPPGIQSKSGYHLVLKTDLPKPLEPEVPAPFQVVPKTPQALCNLLSGLDSDHLGTIVGQLLVEKRVSLIRCQNLLRHSGLLALESGRLHQELLNILENTPPEEEEEEDE